MWTENDRAGCVVHAFHNGERFERVAHLANFRAAGLEPLFNRDTDAFHRAARLIYNRDEPLQRAAVCKKIIDDKNVILGAEKFFSRRSRDSHAYA